MSIVDLDFIQNNITTNGGDPVAYRWSHGATDLHLGDGLIVYALIQMIRAKTCVCLGSGGGYIPRIMTQARYDLWTQGIFKGRESFEWGDIGSTYLVDAANGVGGNVDYLEEDSWFRQHFPCRFINDTTENAYYNFFVKQDIKIDYLHIDADHSFKGVKNDFDLYSKLVRPGGIITIHDTDENFSRNLIVSEDNKKDWDTFDGPAKFVRSLDPSWQIINLFNESRLGDTPQSTGLTIVQKKMPRLNLVTVVADFHYPITLIQMLKHYYDMVDSIVVVFYTTETGPAEMVHYNELCKELQNHGISEKVHIRIVSGPKYDWDKVTSLYNEVVSTGSDSDWWIISDADELQDWGDTNPREIMYDCIEKNKTFVTGGFLDRIGEGGEFTPIKDSWDDLDKLFPLIGFFRYPMSGACPNKVVMVKSGQKVSSGQHYAIFDDGTNSWGGNHPLCYTRVKIPVHHFKWDYSILQRLSDVSSSGCNYSSEYKKMRESIKDSGDKINISDGRYMIERYQPGKKHSQWKKISKLINSI